MFDEKLMQQVMYVCMIKHNVLYGLFALGNYMPST